MEDENPYLPVERKKRNKSENLKTDDNPSGTKYLIVDHEPSEDESGKLFTPSTVDPTKATVILRLETVVSAEETKPKLLPMLNDTMKELMTINKSIEVKSFKEDTTITVFEELTNDNVGQYMKEFKDSAGKDRNMYTMLFKVSWENGTSMASLFKNDSLRTLMRSHRSFLKEHKVGMGAVGDIGHIYLIDPQTFNITMKEKEYNKEMKKWLAANKDHRLNNLKKDIGSFPLVEFRLKHYDITTTKDNVTTDMNISTVDVKCLRQHSQAITLLLGEAMKTADLKVWGFFLQSRAIKDKIPAYITIVKRHNAITMKSGKSMLFNISSYLMNTKTSDGKSLYDDLMETNQHDENMEVNDDDSHRTNLTITNLAPSVSTWMISYTIGVKAKVDDMIKEKLEMFMKKDLYKNEKGHNVKHNIMEHLRPPRQEIILNMEELGIVEVDDSTAIIVPKTTATKRHIQSAFPMGSNTWSNIVQYGDTGSYDGTVGTLRTLQEESLARITVIENRYIDQEAKITRERYEMSQQFEELISQNKATQMENKATQKENAELRSQLTKSVQERAHAESENAKMAILLQESANQINIYRESMNTQGERTRAEKIATSKQHKEELEEMARIVAQQTIDAMLDRNGVRKMDNVLEVNIENNIDGNNNVMEHQTNIYPTTPYGNADIDMDITPQATLGTTNNAPPRHRGSHAGRSGGASVNRNSNNKPSSLQSMLHSSQNMFTSIKEAVMAPMDIQTPLRGNKSTDTSMDDNDEYEDKMDGTGTTHDDLATQEEMMHSDMTNPTDPPDLVGKRL